MTDRFHQPERPSPSDPRRVFVPAPPASPSGPGTERAGAPPRPPRPRPRRARPAVPARCPGRSGRCPPARRASRPTRPLLLLDRRRPGGGGCAGGGCSPSPQSLAVAGVVGGYLWARSVWNRIDRVEVSQVLSDGGERHQLPHRRLRLPREPATSGDAGLRSERRAGRPTVRHDDDPAPRGREGADAVAPPRPVPRDRRHRRRPRQAQLRLQRRARSASSRRSPAAWASRSTATWRSTSSASPASSTGSAGSPSTSRTRPSTPSRGSTSPQSGPVELDGDQALAYVRSRHVHRGDQRRAAGRTHGRPRPHRAPAEVPAGRVLEAERHQEPLRAGKRLLGAVRRPPHRRRHVDARRLPPGLGAPRHRLRRRCSCRWIPTATSRGPCSSSARTRRSPSSTRCAERRIGGPADRASRRPPRELCAHVTGSSTPGFMIPSGSRACLIARMAATSDADRSRASQAFLATPMPCSALIEPRRSTTRSSTASPTASSSGSGPTTFTWMLPSPTWP